ncbi:MAG: NADP-dependent phosphogluconate dehydrogenase, partial [Acidobacteriota bacterium]
VKMVHNGIEYGDMQIIAEIYDLMHRVIGLDATDIAELFERWNEGRLGSFLTEVTARVLRVRDEKSGQPLVEMILDQAGQKGTGRWTARDAIDLGEPVPTLTAAVDARVLSSWKPLRSRAAALLTGPEARTGALSAADRRQMIKDLEAAFYASRVCAYLQGLRLIRVASDAFDWNVDLLRVTQVWKAGCIIRARLLDPIRAVLEQPDSVDGGSWEHLLLDARLAGPLVEAQAAWRRVVSDAALRGVPSPAIGASLSYFDGLRSSRLPQNLTQAQRDYFGAHTYRRVDDPSGAAVHTDWHDLT